MFKLFWLFFILIRQWQSQRHFAPILMAAIKLYFSTPASLSSKSFSTVVVSSPGVYVLLVLLLAWPITLCPSGVNALWSVRSTIAVAYERPCLFPEHTFVAHSRAWASKQPHMNQFPTTLQTDRFCCARNVKIVSTYSRKYCRNNNWLTLTLTKLWHTSFSRRRLYRINWFKIGRQNCPVRRKAIICYYAHSNRFIFFTSTPIV